MVNHRHPSSTRPRPVVIDRAGPMDLTVLAADHAPVPMNMGAILMFQDGIAPSAIRELLTERLPRIPRLRQALRRTPFGCGRPVWLDDPDFDLDRHMDVVSWAEPGSRELLDTAAELLCRPLRTDRPLWRATLVTATSHAALVVVVHHVLADGLGGLAVLAALADEGPEQPVPDFPRPPPDSRTLLADAMRERLRAVRALPTALRQGIAGLRELGFGWTRIHLVEPTSLNQPTSPRRRLTRITTPLDEIAAAAHRHGGTVNDVVLAAVTGALLEIMSERGEHPPRLVVSVPISGRRSTTANELGNNTGVRPISVPATLDDSARLTEIITRTRDASRSTVRASSSGPLGALFRILHRTGLFQRFIDHQRLVHTFETNLRGPAVALHLAGHRVDALIPLVVTPGNVGVTFAVLSYAGTLGVTVIADPDLVPDQDILTSAIHTRFIRLVH
ncbi:wax ester/triacylglycerol synthase domain-containing protein [Nocardia sp. CS682]|uniref:wax ester/triacylglycerol synthase domain-containing protein n=1 Tax=Nocardia sp. CS682 TaxID=1047172 RepID=UPI0010751039|nr:wax ester/triacylglycerol synthase domain-containing protein [Nocardia sp. CS682]QBS45349.1 hypothetical protein DMB37_39995 [Nocardia sp. CS682]